MAEVFRRLPTETRFDLGGRERDSEPKSLATLFFEDRDGTRGESSDDGKEGRSERKTHSSSSSNRSGRDRDRDRTPRDRDRRDRHGSSYHRGRDSHRRDWDRDRDSNIDSSEDESSWSQRSSSHGGTKGYQPYQRGRKGTGGYQSKYGQKHDRFGSSDGSRGRYGGRENSQQSNNWSPSSGRMNTGMTAQQCYALAEKVRKRREKGLSLLPTPKVKPTDNLDQFNYPAPPSWYLEAVEKWDKTQGDQEKSDAGNQVLSTGSEMHGPQASAPTIVTTGNVGTEQMIKPPPLFPPSTQFTPPLQATGGSIFGEPPSGLQPLVPGRAANIAPQPIAPPLPQVPSLFPPNPGALPVAPMALPPNVMAAPNIVPPLSAISSSQPMAVQGEQQHGTSLGVIGVESKEEVTSVSTVKVSSLALNASLSEEGDDAEDEEGRMKIALETPTPQPDASDAKTFNLFPAVATHEGEDTKTDVPGLKDANVSEENLSTTSEVVCNEERKEVESDDREMEVETSQENNTTESITKSDSQHVVPAPVVTTPFIAPANSPPPASDPAITILSSKASPIPVDVPSITSPPQIPQIPPIQLAAPSSPTTTALPEGIGNHLEDDSQSHINSEPEEEDSDYDKYLDQLDEEEDREDMDAPSLVEALSASLLQKNPLDEDFPAINPVNESSTSQRGRDATLKSLLGESLGTEIGGDRFYSRGRGL